MSHVHRWWSLKGRNTGVTDACIVMENSVTDNKIQKSLPPVYPSKAWDPSNVSCRRPKNKVQVANSMYFTMSGRASSLGQIENT